VVLLRIGKLMTTYPFIIVESGDTGILFCGRTLLWAVCTREGRNVE